MLHLLTHTQVWEGRSRYFWLRLQSCSKHNHPRLLSCLGSFQREGHVVPKLYPVQFVVAHTEYPHGRLEPVATNRLQLRKYFSVNQWPHIFNVTVSFPIFSPNFITTTFVNPYIEVLREMVKMGISRQKHATWTTSGSLRRQSGY